MYYLTSHVGIKTIMDFTQYLFTGEAKMKEISLFTKISGF